MTNALTPQQAFEKYFGSAKDLVKQGYPWHCKACKWTLTHLDSDWQGHVREQHKERIMSQKQIDLIEKRARDRADEKTIKKVSFVQGL